MHFANIVCHWNWELITNNLQYIQKRCCQRVHQLEHVLNQKTRLTRIIFIQGQVKSGYRIVDIA